MNEEIVKVEYYPNGNIESEWVFQLKLAGLKELLSRKTWYESGGKKSEEYFKDGKQNGLEVYWFEDGKKSYECEFSNGKEDGLSTRWFENGKICEQRKYIKGKIERSAEWWDEPHQKREEYYNDGVFTHESYWGTDGQKKYEAHSKNLKNNEATTLHNKSKK
jgi:antitoxin component YwqK of YwqJK toxin-antitoxin module